MIEQLASLLLPIDALLAHSDFDPQSAPASPVVSLFRNMWFLCVLFHFPSAEDKDDTAMEWQKPALARIAAKTPAMVLEEAHDGVASEVEYNSVMRQEYVHTVRYSLIESSSHHTEWLSGHFKASHDTHEAHCSACWRHSPSGIWTDDLPADNA
jgi:hypothetical protein